MKERRARPARAVQLHFGAYLKAMGFNGHVATHVMPWHGEPTHIHRCAYYSNNPATVSQQLDLMELVGIDTVLLTWQGARVPFGQSTFLELSKQCAARGMLFGLVLDPGVGKYFLKPGESKEQAIISSLTDPAVQNVLNGPAYLPEKYILDFSTGADFSQVAPSVPGFSFLSWHVGFSWPNTMMGSTQLTNAQSLAQVQKDNAKSTMMVPGLMPNFNDGGYPLPPGVKPAAFTGTRDFTHSVWSQSTPARALDNVSGSFFFDQLAITPKKAPYVALITWNDYEEGTAIEHWVSILTGKRIT